MSESLVIIGNGMAAAKLVEKLSARALGRYAIAVIGEEPQLAYNRVLLSSVLADDVTIADTELKPAKWWKDRGVTLLYGQAAVSVDRSMRRVKLASGATLPYSKLVFATGSRPILLPIEGRDLKGVMTFRDMRDVAVLKKAGKCNAVVIGGGLLGLEAAYGLAKAGAKVTVVHLMDRLMERQLDPEAATMLKAAVESKGIDVVLNAETARFAGDKKVERVELKDGRCLPASIVVMAAGIAPNVALARSAGAAINRGIVVDAHMCTDMPGLYAIGECAEHEGRCAGLVEPAYEQAAVLADTLTG
ncbi:MAG: FAD-dependent oxidoreductase, partial [Pseudorhodoplanes sp.]